MDRSIANKMLTAIRESESLIHRAMADLKGACPEEMWSDCAQLATPAVTDMFEYVQAPIYNDCPDLAPDWYRDGTKMEARVRQLKLSLKARDVLLSAFEAAYEQVQSAAGCLSQISDPLELAMLRFGIHQVSARLCNAKIILLCAELVPDDL